MLPDIKVYKIDYDFIIKNYLDVKLWKQVWTLLVYKQHTFTLNLYRINTKDCSVVFEIKKNGIYWGETFEYSLENSNLTILKKQINGCIFRLMETYEMELIVKSHGYKLIESAKWEERDRLRQIASDYLDNNGVSNDRIREAYIDKFVDDNETVYDKLNKYKESAKYTFCTDMFLMFCKITDDKNRLSLVKDANADKMKLGVIESEIDVFLEELSKDEYVEDMSVNLESI